MIDQDINDIEIVNNDSISTRDALEIVINNWYWFAISVIICLILSITFYKTQIPIYKSEATIIISSDDDKGSILSEAAIFGDIGIGGNSSIIENDIYVFRSTTLINQVIDRLQLNVLYSQKTIFKEIDLYSISPVEVKFSNNDLFIGCRVEIKVLDKQKYKYRIYDRVLKKSVCDWSDAKFGCQVRSLHGRFTANVTPLFSDKINGKVVVIRVNSNKQTSDAILKTLSVTRFDKKAGVLRLSINNRSFLCAKQILNSLIDVYNADVIKGKNRVAKNTEKFILERINTLSFDLENIDGKMAQLKKDNNITDLVTSSGLILEKGARYQEEVIKIETEINIVKFIKQYLLNTSKIDDLIPSLPTSDAGIEEQITAYNRELLYLAKIRDNAGKNNPVTVDLIKRLNVSKENVIRSIENHIESLNIKLKQSKTQEDAAKIIIEDVPTQEKAINIIAREQKIKSELYLYLLNKREENALNLAITESNARIVESADGTGAPISPRLLPIIFLALLIGVIIPSAILYIIRIIDNKIHTKFDVEKRCTIPIVGEIPNHKKNTKNFEFTEFSRDIISESFRIARSNMSFLIKDTVGSTNVVQLTSTIAGEGKTTAIINIALSHAHLGKKVLVIDLDLRKCKLSSNMNSKSNKGVSDYLSEKTNNYSELIIKSVKGSSNLDFIATGPMPPNPTGLLSSQRFIDLIDQLKVDYDYIFLDTVPAMVVADAAIINRVADATLYVIRGGLIDKRYLNDLEKIYRTNKFNNMSILMTGIKTSKSGYSYGYGYSYEYTNNE